MKKVTSKDGTAIAFDQAGQGPALVLVGGALSVRSHPRVAELVELLAPHFTVLSYDRRGRGDSQDTPPYKVEREIEDIEALINQAGGWALVYGMSSGAVLALEAASRLPAKIKKLALYEPPLILDDSRPPVPEDYVQQLNQAVAAGRRGEAVEIFMTRAVGIPEEYLAPMREDPSWAQMEAVAHTLAYDGTIMGDTMSGQPLSTEKQQQWAAASMPSLVMVGGKSEAFFHSAAQTLVKILPQARRRVLEGQDHAVASAALAPVLIEFFN